MRHAVLRPVSIILFGLFLASVVALSVSAGGVTNWINADEDSKVAIRGYDPVAYFTEGRPIKGNPEFAFAWRDAEWHFANAKHRDLFAVNPSRYTPQFGGFCAMAMTQGVIKVVDPEAWTIVDGQLYLNFSQKGRTKFRADLEGNIAKSNHHWTRLQQQN